MPSPGGARRAHSRNPRLFEQSPLGRIPGVCGKQRAAKAAPGDLPRLGRANAYKRSLKIGTDGPRANRPPQRLAAAVREPLPRLLLAGPPGGPGDDLRAGDRRAGCGSGPTAATARSRSCCWSRSACVWTLTEYWLHRLVFHWEPDHPLGRRLHFIIHGVHHDHPNDRMRLVMPPARQHPARGALLRALLADLRDPAAFPLFAGFSSATSPTTTPTTTFTITVPKTKSASACASSTCATTSRTTASASASPPRSGTSSSARCRASAFDSSRR